MASKKVTAQNMDVKILTVPDNDYTLNIFATLPATVAYGATVTAPATALAQSFTPNEGVTALKIQNFSASASNAALSYALSGHTLPRTLTYDGINLPRYEFNVQITNNSPEATITNTVFFTMSSIGTALSGGGSIPTILGTMPSINYNSALSSLDALGNSVASGVSGLVAVPHADYMALTWTNPSDLSAVNVSTSLTDRVTSVGIGTIIYHGTNASYNHTGGISATQIPFFYGVYAADADGNVSTVVATSAICIKTQTYPPNDDPAQNVLDPISIFGETIGARRYRLLAEDLI